MGAAEGKKTEKPQEKGRATPRDAPVEGGVEAVFQAIPEADMPDFTGVDLGPPPAGAPPGYEGRKPTAEVAPQDKVLWDSMASLVCDIFDKAVDDTSDREGPPKPPEKISKEDREKLGQAIADAVHAYGGTAAEFFAKWGPAINLTVVAGSIFFSRIMQAREWNKWRRDEAKKAKRAAVTNGGEMKLLDIGKNEGTEQNVGDAFIRRHQGRETDE
jgi:hypothetical protein